MKKIEIVEHTDDSKEYEKELRRLGWCIPCQGYGQSWDDGSVCVHCNSTGRTPINE
jgi:DnaJ-class molecular chaperone